VRRFLLAACVALATQAVPFSAEAADPAHAKQLHESRCVGCHSRQESRK
jgi:mono/diheme cytochrome c family protein